MSVLGARRPAVLLALVLCAAVLVAFRPVLDNGYVWDDRQYISDNPRVTGGLSVDNLRWALTSFEAGNWHPLTWISHMVDVAALRSRRAGPPPGQPAAARRERACCCSRCCAALTGALWRARWWPRSSRCTRCTSSRSPGPPSARTCSRRCSGCSTLRRTCGTSRRPGRPRYLAVAAAFAAGLAAKPMLVTLPFLLLLLDCWPLGRLRDARTWRRRGGSRRSRCCCSPRLQRRHRRGAGRRRRLQLVTRGARSQRRRRLRPLPRQDALAGLASPSSTRTRGAPWPLWQTLGAAAAGAVTALALLRTGAPYLAVGWLWYLGTLVPVIGLVQVG